MAQVLLSGFAGRADPLDTPPQTTDGVVGVFTNENDDHGPGRSSSAAKKVEGAFKMGFARRSSVLSRFNLFSSADSSDVVLRAHRRRLVLLDLSNLLRSPMPSN